MVSAAKKFWLLRLAKLAHEFIGFLLEQHSGEESQEEAEPAAEDGVREY